MSFKKFQHEIGQHRKLIEYDSMAETFPLIIPLLEEQAMDQLSSIQIYPQLNDEKPVQAVIYTMLWCAAFSANVQCGEKLFYVTTEPVVSLSRPDLVSDEGTCQFNTNSIRTYI